MTVLPEDLSFEHLLSWAQKLVSCFQQAKGKTWQQDHSEWQVLIH